MAEFKILQITQDPAEWVVTTNKGRYRIIEGKLAVKGSKEQTKRVYHVYNAKDGFYKARCHDLKHSLSLALLRIESPKS